MNYKILETESNYPDVLVYRFTSDSDEHYVEVKAFGTSGDDNDYEVSEQHTFESIEAAQEFVFDFSVRSANAFCKRMQITY